jgi:uncharacterized protein
MPIATSLPAFGRAVRERRGFLRRVAPLGLLVWALCQPRVGFAMDYAPINCAKARSAADRVICRNYVLGRSEAHLAALYGVAMSLVAMGQRGDIGDDQTTWIKRREACGPNTSCLRQAYASRLKQLNEILDNIAKGGPY